MGIEKDINQATFKSEYQKGMINIIYTHNWLKEKVQHFFDREGLTTQQFNILRILRGSKTPLSTLQIRERMLDKMSDTSRIVDRLVLKGLAKKGISKTDKRLVDVIISAKGKKLLEKMDYHENEFEKLLQNLSEKEASTLNQLLDKIRQPH
ncbi:MAG TPA: MarR family transcriptional regulator [Ferruginibacter sp.]|nr:MarR family transcriptional regulator [Ferruginibacter sp.]HMP22351.1 MarR family transcriptional regulator [Ferruginibacter sp.]